MSFERARRITPAGNSRRDPAPGPRESGARHGAYGRDAGHRRALPAGGRGGAARRNIVAVACMVRLMESVAARARYIGVARLARPGGRTGADRPGGSRANGTREYSISAKGHDVLGERE